MFPEKDILFIGLEAWGKASENAGIRLGLQE